MERGRWDVHSGQGPTANFRRINLKDDLEFSLCSLIHQSALVPPRIYDELRTMDPRISLEAIRHHDNAMIEYEQGSWSLAIPHFRKVSLAFADLKSRALIALWGIVC